MLSAPPEKNPNKVKAGKAGSIAKWGERRILRLDELDPPSRRLVAALYDLAKAEAGSDG